MPIENRIAALGSSYYISQCYSTQLDEFCDRVIRNTTTGQIDTVITGRYNSSVPLTTAGIDLGLDVTFDALGGQVYINDVLTYVDKYKIGSSDYVDTVFSGIGGVTPKWANTLTAGWRNESITAQVRYVWKKGGKQNFPGADWDGVYPFDLSNNDEFVPLYDEYPDRIPDLNLVNLSVSWKAAENFELTAIVNNVLDKYPPQTTTGYFEQANTNISFYDAYALGRTWTIQARVKM